MSTHTKQVSFRFTPEVRESLEIIKVRDGVPVSEQLRRGVQMWINAKLQPKKRVRR